MPKKYLINLSGHPLPSKKIDGRIVVSVPVQVTFFEELDKMKQELWDTLERIYDSLDESVKKSLAAGLAAIVPPGHSAIALSVIAFFHGIAGHFIPMYFFVRTEEGFKLVGPITLQDFREKARFIRPFHTN